MHLNAKDHLGNLLSDDCSRGYLHRLRWEGTLGGSEVTGKELGGGEQKIKVPFMETMVVGLVASNKGLLWLPLAHSRMG